MARAKFGRSRPSVLNLSPQMRLAFDVEPQVRHEEKVEVRCRECGKRFSVPRWYSEQGVQLHFCSRACRVIWGGEKIVKPYRLRLEGRPEYRGGNWEAQAAAARERDGFCCQNCGVSEEVLGRQLDVHHLVPVRVFASAAESNRLDNLVSVCGPCHKRTEEEGREQMPLFNRVRHPGQREDQGNGAESR